MPFKLKLCLLIAIAFFSMFVTLLIVDQYSMFRNMHKNLGSMLSKASVQLYETLALSNNELAAGMPLDAETEEQLNKLIEDWKRWDARILDITILRPQEHEEQITSVASYDIIYGKQSLYDAELEQELINLTAKDRLYRVNEIETDGAAYLKSYYSNKNMQPAVIRIVYSYEYFQDRAAYKVKDWLKYAGIFMLFILFGSYLLSGMLLRPLKSILWKVNEVSHGRFDSFIKVRSRDEFGLLAVKINAMSQNLSIYMDKLRKAFEENRRMKNFLQSFINHTSDAIHVVDLQGIIIQVNQAFEQLYGYTAEEALGSQLTLIPESHRGEMKLILASLLAGKVLPAQETKRLTKLGEIIPVSVTISPIRDSAGEVKAFASITRDMRSRNKMEELLRRSEKLTTVGQLAAGVAHEIRNPLTTLRGFLQLQLKNRTGNTEHTSLMLSELDRINLIVSEFLILAKPQATQFTLKDVKQVLRDVLLFLDSEAHLHNAEFLTVFAEEPCLISCEENQLKQVFINVLKNAIEAMPTGGPIYIRLKRNTGHITIEIADEGIGIPEELISQIGSPFVTGKESGTGLGMMVSQRIIQSHQGMIDIQSQVNAGTTVTITLPALKDEGDGGILVEKASAAG
ncbi:ATP-binding protein [Paenibacillus sp. Leaf72]|uniref:ATP-binding protein n=1 Tax=Paenibacillus sp. Leaf72 TaxID=1736234 RepID=UPI0006F51B7C|nr:ATP-binding protein [Paenibacillus sp. Leaf72]KQO13788.1 PAS domain-containing sensor histidine kinase [Paenibacillus sp. Leaf72]